MMETILAGPKKKNGGENKKKKKNKIKAAGDPLKSQLIIFFGCHEVKKKNLPLTRGSRFPETPDFSDQFSRT